jgi:hypothetical protein
VATTIFAANESRVQVNGEAIEGVRALEYRRAQARENIFGLGTNERIGVVSGGQVLEFRVRVASTAPVFDALTVDQSFQLQAVLVHGSTQMTVEFDECLLQEKTFELNAGGHGEAVYSFTATRFRETAGKAGQ